MPVYISVTKSNLLYGNIEENLNQVILIQVSLNKVISI